MIVHRRDMRETVADLVSIMQHKPCPINTTVLDAA
jgi:Acetyl-CoA carboxylase beta subunit